jgi:hypothetical protein
MIPALHTVNTADIHAVIKRAGGVPLYVGHGDYSAIWLKNLAAVPRVAQALSDANIPHVAAVFAKDPAAHYRLISPVSRLANKGVRQAYQDLLATYDNPESADIVLLYDENTITMTALFQKINRKGDHGGATWGAQHIPLIISGPGVKAGYLSHYPARLVDIAPTVETLFGIQPQREDGVPLADAMIRPPTWAVTAQAKVTRRMTQDVTALELEATLRPNTKR